MHISPKGLEFIKSFEELRLVAYKCPAGIWTNGYGHTGADVHEGQVITKEQAERWLAQDVAHVEAAIAKMVKVPIEQGMHDALCSFAFNVGTDDDADTFAEGLGDSTLLKLVNVGNYGAAASEFPKWNKSNGKALAGLTRRRMAEKAMFLDGVYP